VKYAAIADWAEEKNTRSPSCATSSGCAGKVTIGGGPPGPVSASAPTPSSPRRSARSTPSWRAILACAESTPSSPPPDPARPEAGLGLMRAAGLRGRHPRAWKKTTTAGQRPVDAPDLIGQDFTAEAPNTRWCGNITYIRTVQGWVYTAILWNAPASQSTESMFGWNLSSSGRVRRVRRGVLRFHRTYTVIDLHSPKVVGYAVADHMRTSLIIEALAAALLTRTPPEGVIFPSDRGCQCTSKEFADFCAINGVRRSMGRRATCYDNAVTESFFATYKKELIHTRPWNDLTEVQRYIPLDRELLQPPETTLHTQLLDTS
jgi:transposase InsO family protein